MVLFSRSSSFVVFFMLCQIFPTPGAGRDLHNRDLLHESAQMKTRSPDENELEEKPSSNIVCRLWNKVWNKVYGFFTGTDTQSKPVDPQFCCRCESSNTQPSKISEPKKLPKWVRTVGKCLVVPPYFCYLCGEAAFIASGTCVMGGVTYIGYAAGDIHKYCAKKCCMLESKSDSSKNENETSENQTKQPESKPT